MTETTEAPAGTALAQVAPGVIAQIDGSKPFTVADLANLVAPPAAEIPADAEWPPVPRPVKFTDALRRHLREIPSIFGKVAPTERRPLEKAEIKALTEEASAIDVLLKEMGARRKDISEYLRMHQDFQAIAEGKDGERIASGVAKGHILAARPEVPYKTPVEGYSGCWEQRYVSGSATQSKDLLDGLLEAGTISRAEHNAFTREVRVLDEQKIQRFIQRNKARGLQILAAITKREAPGASLYAPKS